MTRGHVRRHLMGRATGAGLVALLCLAVPCLLLAVALG